MRAPPSTRPARTARSRHPLVASAPRPVPKARSTHLLVAPASPAPKARSPHLLALTLLLACTPPQDTPGPAAAAAAADLWQTRCANCHGQHGRGDGLSGRSLVDPPRDFTDPAWQSRVTDDHIKQVIVEGGHSAGLSRDMAANTDLAHRPAVVTELVKIVRSFAP